MTIERQDKIRELHQEMVECSNILVALLRERYPLLKVKYWPSTPMPLMEWTGHTVRVGGIDIVDLDARTLAAVAKELPLFVEHLESEFSATLTEAEAALLVFQKAVWE